MSAFDGEPLLGVTAPEEVLRWYLTRIAEGIAGDPLDGLEDEVRERFGAFATPTMAGFIKERVRNYGGSFSLVDVERVSDTMVVGIVDAGTGVRWRATAVGDPITGEFGGVGSAQAPREGLVVHHAEPHDGRGIADLIRRVPMNIGDHSLLIDYGDDYLAATAMADDRTVIVAEVDGRIVGIHGVATAELVVHGAPMRGRYIRHTRIDPSTKGMGVFSALNGVLMEGELQRFALDKSVLRPFSLVAVANDDMLRMVPTTARTWGTPWERFHLDTATMANEHGRDVPSVLDDLEHVTALITYAQGGAPASVPVDPVRLRRRLERSPTLYGPDRLRGNSAAVVGVGRSDVLVGRNGSEPTREALAFDVGLEPDGGDQLLGVLRGWCAQLAGEGIDRLVVGCGTMSPVRAVVAPFAVETERYQLNCPWPPPTDRPPSFAFDHALM